MTARTTSRPSTLGNISLWVLQVLLALVFVFVAIPKLMLDRASQIPFDLIGVGAPGMIVVGIFEVIGAVALLIPRLSGLAALCQIPLMVGATVLSAFVTPGLMSIPAVTLVGVVIVAWFRRMNTFAVLRVKPR